LLTLGLSLPVQAGEVAGTVFDARGRPAAGVELTLGGQRAVSAADGTYAFADVAEGEHRVLAGSQAVAVVVPAEGAVRRNLFLLSAAARTRVTGTALPEADAAVLAETRRQAARLLAEGDGRPARRMADITG
jgi:hypothetical protein